MKKELAGKLSIVPFSEKTKPINSVGQRLEPKSFPYLKTYLNRNITRVEAE